MGQDQKCLCTVLHSSCVLTYVLSASADRGLQHAQDAAEPCMLSASFVSGHPEPTPIILDLFQA